MFYQERGDIMRTFGEFISLKRKEKRITLKAMAEELEISTPYMSDVEKGRRYSFDLDKLEKIAKILNMSEEEKNEMMDLAGKQREEVAPDLPEYINSTPAVSVALRKARDLNLGEKEWYEFIEKLENDERKD